MCKRAVSWSWKKAEIRIGPGRRYRGDICRFEVVFKRGGSERRIDGPMLGFKTFRCERILAGGIELMHMIKTGQLQGGGSGQTLAE